MKNRLPLLAALLSGALALPCPTLFAANATWNKLLSGDATGSWNTPANPPWSTGAVPGAGDVADFSTLNITTNCFVSLDGDQSIDALLFGDTITSSTGIWYITNGVPATSMLTLTGPTPTITVNAMGSGRVSLAIPLAGSAGLTKAGAGTLTISNFNTFTGNTRILGGTLGVGAGDGCLGAVPDSPTPDSIYLDAGTIYNLRAGNIIASTTITNNRGVTIGLGGGTFTVNNAPHTFTFLGPVTGAGQINKNGAGIVIFNAPLDTFTGKFSVTSGTISYGVNGGDLGVNPASFVPDSITLNGGGLQNRSAVSTLVNWTVPSNRGITLGANGGYFNVESTSGNVGIYADSVISGTGQLRKTGGGALILNTFNTYIGGTVVTNGSILTASSGAAIILGEAGGLGSGPLTFINTNSLTGLRYAGATNGVVPNNIVLSTNANFTNRWVVDANTPATFTGVISGGHASSVLQMDGLGTLALAGVNTSAGTTRITRGKLYGVTGGAMSNSPVVLGPEFDAAALGVRVTDNTRRWTIPSLAIEAGGLGPSLEFYFTTDGSTTVAPLNVTGQVQFNTYTTVHVWAGGLKVTTGDGYPLMTWGSMTGTPPEDWNLQLEPAGWVTGTLKVIGNTLYLQIQSTIEPLRWAAGNNVWDTTSFLPNWMNSAAAPSLTYFQDNDAVQFEDTQNTGGGIITLNGVVSPSSTWVNSANDYTFTSSGPGVLGGYGPLIKSGPGTLTLAGDSGNTFIGGLTVNGGTVVTTKPDGTDFGACGNGNVTVNSGGRIVAQGTNSLVGQITSAGKTITINAGGSVTNTAASAARLNRVVLNGGILGASTANPAYGSWSLEQGVATLGGGTTSTITGGNLSLSQPGGTVFNVLTGDTLDVFSALDHALFGADTGLIKNGNGTLNLFGSCTSTGAVALNGGTLRLGNSQALPSGTFTLGTGFTIASTDSNPRTIPNTLSSGIASAILTFGDATGTGKLTFTGPFGFLTGTTGRGFVTATDVEFAGPITGANGPFTKTGTGALIISGNATVAWSGGWNINTGALLVNGTLSSTSAVTIASGALLGGGGLVQARVTVNSGGTVAPGSSIGTLTLTNAPAWNGATIQMELNQTNAQTADKLQLTSGGFNFTGTTLSLVNTGPSLTTGVFTLFSTGNTGTFAATNLPALDASLTWDFSTLLSDGTLKIIAAKPTTPTNVTWSLSGNHLTLSWPANYLGWTLQRQVNPLDVGVSNNWTDVPGTATVTSFTVTVDPALPTVFYRLRY